MGKRVAVLGAGPMGLAVAYQLVKDGHHPVIYEADDRVGGMTAAFDFSGLHIERYYHFHCINDHAFLEILDELGISDKVFWVPTKMGYWYQNHLQAWGNPIALLRFKGLSFYSKFRYGFHAFLCTKRNNWKPLDSLNAVDWIKSAIGKEAYEILWKRLFEYKFHGYTNNLSAAWIWSRIRRIGRSRYSIFKEKLGYMDGGSETLLHAMKSFILKNGGEINLSSPVQKIDIRDGKVYGIRIGGDDIQFEKIISTIPLPYIPTLIPDLDPALLAQYQNVKNIAVVCVILKTRKKVSDKFWININDPEMDIPGLVEYTNLRPLNCHIIYAPFYLPAEHPMFSEENDIFSNKVKRYIKKINPDFSDEDFLDVRVSRYRYAQPICQPNFLDGLPSEKLPVTGLWVADTSYYYPEDRGISESIGFGRSMARNALKVSS